MKPIWYFVGLLLVIIGALVVLGGWIEPAPATRLGHLRPALWWGAVMIGSGVAFLLANAKKRGQ